MESAYNKAIETYYAYKSQYEHERSKKKEKIIENDNLTLNEKQQKLKNIKIPCLFCNRKVNMTFKHEKKMLYALCGDVKQPCDKKIIIRRSEFLHIDEALNALDEGNKSYVQKIIDTKSKLLFQIDDEANLLAEFEEYISLYNDTSEISLRLLQKKENMTLDFNSSDLSVAISQLETLRQQVRDIMEKYNSSPDKDVKLLREIASIYKDHIQPTEIIINDLKFKHREVTSHKADGKGKEYQLITYPRHMKESEVIFDLEDPEVIQMDI